MTIEVPPENGVYQGVHLVRIAFENGSVKSIELPDNLVIEKDALGNYVSRPADIQPVFAMIGQYAIPGPHGEMS